MVKFLPDTRAKYGLQFYSTRCMVQETGMHAIRDDKGYTINVLYQGLCPNSITRKRKTAAIIASWPSLVESEPVNDVVAPRVDVVTDVDS